jgi:hypothetical protein
MKKTMIALLVAVVAGVPIGWFVAMLLTPVFWWLESILHRPRYSCATFSLLFNIPEISLQ